MSDIKSISRYISKIRWLTISAIILLCMGSTVADSANFSPTDISFSKHSTEICHSFTFISNYSPLNRNHGDLEIQEVEDDDDELHSNRKLFLTSVLAPVPSDISSVYFPKKKEIKLFILFHSWKSYLHI